MNTQELVLDVLRTAVQNPTFVPTTKAIAQTLTRDEQEVRRILLTLKKEGVVHVRQDTGGITWFLH
jgi:hypothetical protein